MNKRSDARKICFLFALDKQTNKVINQIMQYTKKNHRDLLEVAATKGCLPYHLTMIGGVNASLSDCEEIVRGATSLLMPFQDTDCRPQVIGIEPLEMNGNYLGIRLKLKPGSYVLTGNGELNERLVAHLNPVFSLDSVRHITTGKVVGGFSEMHTVKPTFSFLLNRHRRELEQMAFIPQVWVKMHEKWHQYKV